MEEQNPFLLDIEEKAEYTLDELKDIQCKLEEKKQSMDEILQPLFPAKNGFYSYEDFKYRCSMGFRQKIIHPDSEVLPEKQLYTIGDGGDGKNCIICCTPFSHEPTEFNKNMNSSSRFIASQQIINSLEEVGYNGHFYLLNGGFPNPTGTEMKYAGVPYSFKIFMMLEAKKLGFEKVIWIDSGCYATTNPRRLFDILDEQETLMHTVNNSNNNYDAMVFEKTIQLLNTITGSNIYDAHYINTVTFGLNVKSKIITKIIEEYYDMVKLGRPFLSIFPEEIVLTSIFNKPEYRHLLYNQLESRVLNIHERNMDLATAKQHGYYFLHRNYA